ncbi:hypothetical protein [Paracidovorax konjaci]|uniref:Uncharacterized protein n=1 Tax=Paracidovorax konjaci TaxID=32040 RepID=A0A1I1V5H4_9BURK|nr:hypothetical protein [Paracidovorax konjaci]SFD78139.1 hypothetical protein SAMN04489710_10657 [Paracidovorax konjaci]
MPYAVFLAMATLSCAAYVIQVDAGTAAAAQPAPSEPASLTRADTVAPPLFQPSTRETHP